MPGSGRYVVRVEKRKTQEERTAESRRRLIEAAIELLATRGYARTSLAAIGDAAGLSRGLVTHHFGSKEQCIVEVVAHIVRTIGYDLQERAQIRGLASIDALFETYLSDRSPYASSARAMYVVMVEAMTAAPDLLPGVAANNQFIRTVIGQWIGEAVELGEIEPPADIDGVSIVIEGILRGVLQQILIDPDAVDRAAAIKACIDMVRGALGAR
ncbi:TetR/AcrR family transcriptional regulator [Nocardia sp. NPDC058176]|uniref:TetR/AcrR family transcriptional regulator n=1 Tax=Nocardia sp. NPDC058176 TaxID=3346368 RepID=UPI0036DBEC46